MKNVFVILALVAIAGCSGMRQSSGMMGSGTMGSGTSGDTSKDYSDAGIYNPGNWAPIPISGP